MLIQVVSDLHLEFKNSKPHNIVPVAPVLALLGDIGNPFSEIFCNFIAWCASKFDIVLFVAGNHEYYYGDHNKTKEKIAEICNLYDNVKFLDCNDFVYVNPKNSHDRIKIVGCTLWSNIDTNAAGTINKYINDYRYIKVNDQHLTVSQSTEWHKQNRNWLENQILHSKENICILTHHAPLLTGTSSLEHENSILNTAFASDLSALMGGKVKAWFYGHSHYNSEQVYNGTLVASNQLGYFGEQTNFSGSKTFSIDSVGIEDAKLILETL